MISKYLYLSIDVATFAIPFAASLSVKTPFYRNWKYVIAALSITALLFVLWDEVFTQLGIWHVNERYVTGIYIGSLPLEEVLFFICLPYALLFAFFALNEMNEKDYLFPHQELISSALIIVLLIAGMYYREKIYTGATFLLLAVFLAFQLLRLRPRYMGRFYFTVLVLLVPLWAFAAIFSGVFTDEPLVHYNTAHHLGFMVGALPVETLTLIMLLMVLPVTIWHWLDDYFYYRQRKSI